MTTRENLSDQILHKMASKYGRAIDPKQWVVQNISQARKFVLDEQMAAFSADLAYAFLPKLSEANLPRVHMLLEGLRSQARLPHAKVWIEFDMQARTKRACEVYAARNSMDAVLDYKKSPQQGAWLLEQHPKMDTWFRATECVSHTRPDGVKPDQDPFNDVTLVPNPSIAPLSYVWSVDDTVPQWSGTINTGEHRQASGLLTGIMTYRVPQIAWAFGPWVDLPRFRSQITNAYLAELMHQLSSDLRYLWTLLVALNDVPVGYRTVTPQRGHMVGRSYKKFSAHTVVTLNIPQKMTLQKLAKRIAMAARRRAHQVRGHHRADWRNPLRAGCQHVFGPVPDTHLLQCRLCEGRKMWIKEHSRGDASIGYTLHDYAVTHPMGVQK